MTVFDTGLETLLELDGEIFPMENGYWTKFEVHRVEPSKEIPHGIKYSLTLHNRQNQRIVGFDNAHGVKLKKHRYAAKKITWDHKHLEKIVMDYEFESAGQLMEDFWHEVDKVLGGF
ncbi:toxin-antitoxin system TumE family protein [Thiomicrorhabdus sp.]|uniref:toxin-antitoxin system TumE family protein n=1 Tax=Thiomicrorhabdus sp. TaxID=2039724 RepID=UPI0029C7D39E|nr:DUF6516 family protein [Thiomicrorhabdus sp.]